jgi:hypothetical protein
VVTYRSIYRNVDRWLAGTLIWHGISDGEAKLERRPSFSKGLQKPSPANRFLSNQAGNEKGRISLRPFSVSFSTAFTEPRPRAWPPNGMLHVYMNSLLDTREGTFSSIGRISRRRGNRKRILPAVSGISMSHPVLRDRFYHIMDREGPIADFGNCARRSNR